MISDLKVSLPKTRSAALSCLRHGSSGCAASSSSDSPHSPTEATAQPTRTVKQMRTILRGARVTARTAVRTHRHRGMTIS